MNNYWENRYNSGGNSGLGSYGKYAEYKAKIINEYILKLEIKSISDFGSGDGNQISLLDGYETYCGYDISEYILNKCREIYKNNSKIKFVNKINELPKSDMCLSLDVLYHIVDENEFKNYINHLFEKSMKYVLIFTSNHNRNDKNSVSHIFHRKTVDYIIDNIKEFKLIDTIITNSLDTSANFYLYKKIN